MGNEMSNMGILNSGQFPNFVLRQKYRLPPNYSHGSEQIESVSHIMTEFDDINTITKMLYNDAVSRIRMNLLNRDALVILGTVKFETTTINGKINRVITIIALPIFKPKSNL